jgi:hypothetical protein
MPAPQNYPNPNGTDSQSCYEMLKVSLKKTLGNKY